MSIRPNELEDRLERDEQPFVLDIRPSEMYRERSIESSHNIPCYDALRRGDDSSLVERLDELPNDEEIVVVCKQGVVAKRATRLLTEHGYDAVTLAYGWMAGVQKRNCWIQNPGTVVANFLTMSDRWMVLKWPSDQFIR